MALRDKQQAFVEAYLTCFNATRAALDAGYSEKTAYSIGARLLKNVEISEAVSTRLQESAMSADEVLMRLADHARGDMGEYLSDDGEIDISEMKRSKKTHLLRKVKRTYRSGETESGGTWEETRVEVEIHDAQAALVHLGRHHKLFTDKTEMGGIDGAPIPVSIVKMPVSEL